MIPGQGVGKIIFGSRKKELNDILGEPDEVQRPENDERTDWETYWYSAIKCSFSFDPGSSDCLVEIIVENGYFHIAKKIRVGLGREDLLKVASELGFGEYSLDLIEDSGFSAQEKISYQKVGLQLLLEEKKISAICLRPFLNQNGSIIWPDVV